MGRTDRPTGLAVLAVLGFIFAAARTLNVIVVLRMLSQLRPGEAAKLPPGTIELSVAEPAVMAVLLVVASIGFLKVNYWAGYVGGHVLALVWLAFSVLSLVLGGAPSIRHLRHFAGAAYSVTLLCLLNVRYRSYFVTERQSEEDPSGDSE